MLRQSFLKSCRILCKIALKPLKNINTAYIPVRKVYRIFPKPYICSRTQQLKFNLSNTKNMKQWMIVIALALTAITANAQRTKHALGAHFGGSTMDLEYQYHFTDRNFLDVTAGVFDLGDGLTAQAVYNWNIRQWNDWTPRFATWKWWGGVGGGVGFYNHGDHEGMMLGPVGLLGFGFTLNDIPLTIGLDYRPMVAFVLGDNSDLIDSGFKNVGVTLTYRF